MKTIPDEQIQAAAPEEIIEAFSNLVYKIANRYRGIIEYMPAYDVEDLEQTGKMALLKAQKTYQPGERGFISWAAGYIKAAIRNTLLLWKDTSRPETPLISLDAALTDETENSLLDIVPDEDTPPTDEQATDKAYKEEVAQGVRDALERMRNAKQREALTKIYLEGKDTQQTAAEMGLTVRQIQTQSLTGRQRLRRDYALKKIAAEYYHTNTTLQAFKSTGYSAVELALVRIERKYNHIFGEGAFLRKDGGLYGAEESDSNQR